MRDEVFDLSEPGPGAGILVIGGDAGLLDKLAGRGIRHRDAPELTPADLAGAGVVAFPPRSEGERADAVPAAAFAVLAARRFLIAPRAGVTFGLLPGVDHLAAGTEDEVVQYADALQTFPEAFGLQAALGRVAAERQRASTVYERVVAESSGVDGRPVNVTCGSFVPRRVATRVSVGLTGASRTAQNVL